MIHPDTEVRFISPVIGNGIFATRPIPMGTLVYVRDELEIELTEHRFKELPPVLQELADRYSYIDCEGVRVLSWDNAKLVNHSCDSNTLATPYGMEIAIRDIEAGEELTDDYGQFNVPEDMDLVCGCEGCRGLIRHSDPLLMSERWDGLIRSALERARMVEQPLLALLQARFRERLEAYLRGEEPYISVLSMRCTAGIPG